MDDRWVSLQLPTLEEGPDEDTLVSALRSYLPLLEIFVPTLTCKDKRGTYTYSLFDGYVFVRGPYTDRDYLRLSDCSYVRRVLTVSFGRDAKRVAYTPDPDIQRLKDKLQEMMPSGFAMEDKVNVIKGLFSGLKGRIVNEVDDTSVLVEVYMPLGSLTKLTTIPKMFLSKDDPE